MRFLCATIVEAHLADVAFSREVLFGRAWVDTDMSENRLSVWALTSAMAGFLFGFDTVVVSGVEKKVQER